MIWLFILGLVLGSFLNVLIFRLNTEDKKVPKFWQGRSICPKCKKQIAWFDNIPLLSFIFLRAKCRHCKKPISWQYPVVELVTAVVTACVIAGNLSNLGILSILSILIIAWVFIVIFFSDLIYGLIPDEAVIIGIAAAAIFKQNLVVGAGSALAFFVVVLATKFRGMGLGDVKLAFLIGLVLGWPAAAVGFWIAFVLGGALAVILIVLKRVNFSATIALGPFLIIGALVAALWSTKIIQYLGL